MADKSAITNLEGRIGQLLDDHRRLAALCREPVSYTHLTLPTIGG